MIRQASILKNNLSVCFVFALRFYSITFAALHTVIKVSTISELYLEVPQGQSCISRKFSNFNFQAIARNISRFLFSSYLLIHFCIPQDSNREHSGQEASTFPTELSSILIRNCAPTWRRRKKLSTREIPRNVSRFMLTEPR